MNRDIESRGKDIRTGKWIYGYLRKIWSSLDSRERFTICPAERFASDGFTDTGEVEVIPETVGQYTGLKDKDGVKIFEGDILENACSFPSYERKVVFWKDDTAQFLIKFIDESFCPICNLTDIGKENIVIGNIHDNPELLEGRE
jgi:uncharacterized phage protein (TIGR01671 family)